MTMALRNHSIFFVMTIRKTWLRDTPLGEGQRVMVERLAPENIVWVTLSDSRNAFLGAKTKPLSTSADRGLGIES